MSFTIQNVKERILNKCSQIGSVLAYQTTVTEFNTKLV